MEKKDLELIEKLLPQNEELRELMEKHLAFERKLEELAAKRYLTPEQELERKRIQKLKLAGKDRIEAILANYRRNLTEKD